MVKPTIKSEKAVKGKKAGYDRSALIEKMKTNKEYRNKVLLNTANKWAKRNGFNGDLTFAGVSDTGKSFHIAVDGHKLTAKYVLVGNGDKATLISGRAIAFAGRQ
jgi:hypothetical protein